jgi:hypothetical protein
MSAQIQRSEQTRKDPQKELTIKEMEIYYKERIRGTGKGHAVQEDCWQVQCFNKDYP